MQTNHKIKAVIFDMGGVFLRSGDATTRLRLASQLGTSLEEVYREVFNSESARKASVGEITEEQHWLDVAEHFHLLPSEMENFQDLFWAGDLYDLTLINFIRSLRPKRKTGLLSNAWSGARNMLTQFYPCLDAFDASIFSAEVHVAKPDARIYEMILSRLDVKPAESIFVDDFIENIDAANQLGIHGIHFRSPEQARKDIMNLLGE